MTSEMIYASVLYTREPHRVPEYMWQKKTLQLPRLEELYLTYFINLDFSLPSALILSSSHE